MSAHWSYGHNVAGYLPESDVTCVADWADAQSGLSSDIEYEADSLGYLPDDDSDESKRADHLSAALDDAKRELSEATAGQEFLAYVDDGGTHTIPTAYWINACTEDHETDSDDL